MDTTAVVGTRLDYFVILLYFVLIFSFGFIFARFTRSTKDFFFGGQRFSWWLITFSCVASVVGSYSFVKYSAAGFRYGMSSSMTYLNDWIVMGFLLLGWLPILYFGRIGSVPDYFKKRFDGRTAVMATIIVLLYMVGYIGINLYTMGIALNAMLGTNIFLSAVVVAVVCAVYVTIGGQTSVIMTDLAQGIILLIGGFLLFFLGLHVLGGWEAFWSGLPILHRLPFAKFNEPHEFHFVGIFWQDGIANTFALYMMNQGFILRFLSLKSVKEIKKTFLSLVLVLMPLAAFAVSNAGWLGRAMVSQGVLPPDVDAHQIFVRVANTVCQPGLFGFVMAALTAALMSTIDTLINAVSAVAVNDVYKPYVAPNASDKHHLRVARIVSFSAALMGIALVPVFASFKSIYVAHGSFTASITPPMVVTIVLGVYWKKFTSSAAFWTLFGGTVMVVLSIAWPVLITPFSHGVDPSGGFKYMRALFGLAASGIIAVLVSYLTKTKSAKAIEGLVVGTLDKAKEKYKGAPANEVEGKKVAVLLNVSEEIEELSVSQKIAQLMSAKKGDIVYVSDARRWLGGLRSVHARISAIHEEDTLEVWITPALAKQGNLVVDRKHRIEKII
ncbi:MAG: sodium/solute symporter [Candidatus Aminicenantes bacterium]|nr:sodium/solute symporter [Candidatus Aminicenantes bacterium]